MCLIANKTTEFTKVLQSRTLCIAGNVCSVITRLDTGSGVAVGSSKVIVEALDLLIVTDQPSRQDVEKPCWYSSERHCTSCRTERELSFLSKKGFLAGISCGT